MNRELLFKINRKPITVSSLEIVRGNGSILIRMRCITEDRSTYNVEIRNATKIKIYDISYPFFISRLEITDSCVCSVQEDSLLFVNDGEDGRLSFYCESLDVYSYTEK